jgi:hypothetical protein
MGMSRLGLSVLFIFFAAAAQLAATDAQGRCTVPLKLRHGIPFVQVMLNGRGPFTFAVDTGTSRDAIVSPAVLKALQLPLVGRTWLLDLGGRREAVDMVEVDTLTLTGREFHKIHAMVHEPLATIGHYDGVLGFALFQHTVLTLDFPQRCLRLDDADLAAGADPDVVPFSMPRNVPVVAVRIGKRVVPAQIDSGGGGINLPASAASAFEFDRETEAPVRAQSQLSTFLLRAGVMKGELALGGQIFKQPFVEINDLSAVGNLGAISLQDFAITFDQSQRLVRFQAHKKTHRLSREQLAMPAGD